MDIYLHLIPWSGNKVRFLTENEYNINRLNKLLNKLEVNYNIKMQGKNYVVEVKKDSIDVGKKDFFKSQDTIKAGVRGAFLGGGSISEPSLKYHLEIRLKDEDGRQEVIEAISQFNIDVKKLDRKYSYSIYIKGGEEISKLLALIGANSSVLKYEDIRVLKDTKNNVNRKVNCETANLNKTVNAAVYQIQAIEKLKKEKKFSKLPENLKEIAELRLKNPDCTLIQLGEMLPEPIRKIWCKP